MILYANPYVFYCPDDLNPFFSPSEYWTVQDGYWLLNTETIFDHTPALRMTLEMLKPEMDGEQAHGQIARGPLQKTSPIPLLLGFRHWP